MTLDLEHDDIVTLVMGTGPNYNLFDVETIKENGYYTDCYGRWTWYKENLQKLSDVDLIKIYKLCKQSWK